ncbi:hypothetical protein C1H46_043859 [Malus baccata]|uniref:Uncharacterized protein n=1 Tax=Malus baccata TaxID=106549 RepID=A0A540K8Q0_MALBA|nr:hypothetical protein C1H46_043859 [Malus baccata]
MDRVAEIAVSVPLRSKLEGDKPASTSLDPPRVLLHRRITLYPPLPSNRPVSSFTFDSPRVLIQLLSSINPPPFLCPLHREETNKVPANQAD